MSGGQPPDARTIRRWRRYLADERAEAAVYRRLAQRRSGEERNILLELAEAEGRHAAHWRELLAAHAAVGSTGASPGSPSDPSEGATGVRFPGDAARDAFAGATRGSVRTQLLAFLAGHFGSVFILAIAQRAESRSPYATDEHATSAMAADERIHSEVVRALAARGRSRLAGSFRAAVFGANDGLVSNLALMLGVGAAGADTTIVLLTGLAGLLAGALSMGAGEYVSVRSQRELLQASVPDPHAATALPHLDLDANELALVYRARGMSAADAAIHASAILAGFRSWHDATEPGHGVDPIVAAQSSDQLDFQSQDEAGQVDEHEVLGTAWRAAASSFCFFASGAVIPVLPFLFGATGVIGQIAAAAVVGVALLATGAVVGLLSGASPLKRAVRQLAIGYGAAAATYILGLVLGA
ncbi:MAG: VIT1/CCC1 family protein [Nakamurella sp.]